MKATTTVNANRKDCNRDNIQVVISYGQISLTHSIFKEISQTEPLL